MTEEQDRTVGEAAGLVGVSVRTLHHWHEIGLVAPQGRSYAGYRLYSEDDLARIHQVLLYRETGMPLAQVKEILDAADDPVRHLARQRQLLAQRISHLQEKVSAVEQLMEEMSMEKKVSAKERAEILGEGWDPAWDDEAEERWGDTEEWKHSSGRVAQMSTDDWKVAKANVDVLEETLAKAFSAGVEPGSDEADELAELHLAWLNQWVETTHEKQVLMARMYTEDPRFQAHYDDRVPGLAAWVRTIVEENVRSRGIDPDKVEWR